MVCTFPCVLAHGPLEYGDLEIPKLYTVQIIAHVTMLLWYGPDVTDPTGSLLHVTGEAMRLKVGYIGELLAAPLILFENIANSWMKHVWISTQAAGITVLTAFLQILLQRHGDMEIMHLFVQSGWKQLELQILNQCRMFLKVFLLSKIVKGTGTYIASQFWDCPHPADSPYLSWPRTPTPAGSSWKLWQQVLSTSLHLGRNQRLALSLGMWYAQMQPNSWYYHPDTNSLWLRTLTQWL